MQLFAKTSDPFLLKKSIHRDGITFYHLCSDDTIEVAYFSGSRIIDFKGTDAKRYVVVSQVTLCRYAV